MCLYSVRRWKAGSLEQTPSMYERRSCRVVTRGQLYETPTATHGTTSLVFSFIPSSFERRRLCIPCTANSSIIITLKPSPLSALQSTSICPVTELPATKRGSVSVTFTLTFGWCGEAFIGSMFAKLLLPTSEQNPQKTSYSDPEAQLAATAAAVIVLRSFVRSFECAKKSKQLKISIPPACRRLAVFVCFRFFQFKPFTAVPLFAAIVVLRLMWKLLQAGKPHHTPTSPTFLFPPSTCTANNLISYRPKKKKVLRSDAVDNPGFLSLSCVRACVCVTYVRTCVLCVCVCVKSAFPGDGSDLGSSNPLRGV